jgi:hypothetical protein
MPADFSGLADAYAARNRATLAGLNQAAAAPMQFSPEELQQLATQMRGAGLSEETIAAGFQKRGLDPSIVAPQSALGVGLRAAYQAAVPGTLRAGAGLAEMALGTDTTFDDALTDLATGAEGLVAQPEGPATIGDAWQQGDMLRYSARQIGSGVGSTIPSILAAGAGTAIGGPVGGIAGAAAASYALQAGSMYNDLRDRGVSHEDAAAASGVAAIPMAALDVVGLRFLPGIGRFVGAEGQIAGGMARRAAVGAGRGAAAEALTEGAQQGIQEGATSRLDPDYDIGRGASNILESMVAGGLTGGLFGAGGGAVQSRVRPPEEEPPPVEDAGPAPEMPPPMLALPPPANYAPEGRMYAGGEAPASPPALPPPTSLADVQQMSAAIAREPDPARRAAMVERWRGAVGRVTPEPDMAPPPMQPAPGAPLRTLQPTPPARPGIEMPGPPDMLALPRRGQPLGLKLAGLRAAIERETDPARRAALVSAWQALSQTERAQPVVAEPPRRPVEERVIPPVGANSGAIKALEPVAEVAPPRISAIPPAQLEEPAKIAETPVNPITPAKSEEVTGMEPASWVVVDKATGKGVMETSEEKTAQAVNRERYDVIPALEYLQNYNRAVREAGGVEPATVTHPPRDVTTRPAATTEPAQPERVAAPQQVTPPPAPPAEAQVEAQAAPDVIPETSTNEGEDTGIAAPKPVAAKRPRAPQSLIPYLAATGGIQDAEHAGELKQMGLDRHFVPGVGRLVRKTARSLDYARERAAEQGYLPADSTVDDLLQLLDQETRGQKVYARGAEGDVQARADEERAREEQREVKAALPEVRAAAKDHELTPAELRRVAEIMVAERMDAADALDRFIEDDAIAREDSNTDFAETGEGDPGADIPFDVPVRQRGTGEPAGEARGAPEEPAGRGQEGDSAGGQAAAAEPRSEAGAEGLPQLVLPGAERSAKQAMAARDAKGGMRGRGQQKATDEGLFGEAEDDSPPLFRRPERGRERRYFARVVLPGRRIESRGFTATSQSEAESKARQWASDTFGQEPRKVVAAAIPDGGPKPDAIHKELRNLLRRIAGSRVRLDARSRLLDPSGNPIDGRYLRGVISVALDESDPELTVRHEAIHFLREVGAIDGSSWRALERRAAQWRKDFDIDGRYEGLSEAELNEEAIAEAYGRWAGGKLPKSSQLDRPFGVVRRVLAAIRDALKMLWGGSLPSAEQVFAAIEEGAFADRGGEPGANEDPSFSRLKRGVDRLVSDAQSQASWRDWYDRHQAVLRDLFDDDADLFQKLLSATSQMASVKANVGLALKAYRQLKLGQPFTGYLPAVIKNLERIAAAEAVRGPKISQYGAANEGAAGAVAVDRHIAELLFGTKTPTTAMIAKAQQTLTTVARKLGWQPRQVQAALWAFNQVRKGTDPANVQSYDTILLAKADAIRAFRSAFDDAGGEGAGEQGRGEAPEGAGEGEGRQEDLTGAKYRRLGAAPSGARPSFVAEPEAGPLGKLTQGLTRATTDKSWWKETALPWLTQNYVNKLDPIARAEVRRFGKLQDASRSAFKAAEMAAQDTGRFEMMVKHGALSWDAGAGVVRVDTSTGGLADIFSQITDEADYNAFQGYAYAKRAQRLIKEGRERLMSPADITKALAVPPAAKARYDAMLGRYQRFNEKLLDFLVDTGTLKPALRDLYASSMDYVPFYRVMEETGDLMAPSDLRAGLSNPDPRIKRLKGGKAKLDDLFDNISRNTRALASAGLRNVAMQRTHDLLSDLGEMTDVAADATKGDDAVSYYVGGQKRWFRPHDGAMFMALAPMPPEKLGALYNAMKGMAGIFRAGITLSPSFMIANAIRGFAAGYVQTGQNLSFKYNTLSGFKNALKDSPSIQAMKAASGTGGYRFGPESPSLSGASLRRMTGAEKGGIASTMAKAMDRLEHIGEATELAERDAIYNNLRAKGVSEAEASYQAMNLINYGRSGLSKSLRFLIPLVPFLNARIQGLYRMFENHGDRSVLPGIAARGALLMAGTLGLWALNNWDEEDRERYEAEPLERKLNYFIIYGPGDTKILIPKPFEFGSLFATLPEALMDALTKENGSKDLGTIASMTLLNTFAFNPVPAAVLPALEVATNYDFFRQQPLENMAQERLAPELRAGPTTSATARAIGSVTGPLAGLSPIEIQHLMEGYLGLFGASLMASVDAVAGAAGILPGKPTGALGSVPVVSQALENALGRFIKRSDIDPVNRWVGDLYDLKAEADQIYASARYLRANGEAERARELMKDEKGLLSVRKMLSSASDDLSDLNRRMNAIRADRSLSGAEMRAKLDPLVKRRNDLAKRITQAAEQRMAAAA